MKLDRTFLTAFTIGATLIASASVMANEKAIESDLSEAIKASLATAAAEIDSKIAVDVISINNQLLETESEYQVIGTVTAPNVEVIESETGLEVKNEVEEAE